MPCTVTFKPTGLTVSSEQGTPLIKVARQAGIPLLSSCGGNGTCGRCRVRILSGGNQPPNAEEIKALPAADVADGSRLACQVRISGDTTVDIPSSSLLSPYPIPLQSMTIALPPIEAAVHDYAVDMVDANLHDVQADGNQLAAQLRQKHHQDVTAIDASVLASLPEAIQAGAGRLRISLRKREAISIRQGGSTPWGLAIDLGTTTMAGYLIDLENGMTLSAGAVMNPQCAFGGDIMSRITHILENGDRELRRAAADGLNALIAAMCGEPERIIDLTVVGNTAMHHIFLGLPVQQLGRAPYQPSLRESRDLKARDLGLVAAPGAYVHLPPPAGGFVGSDHLAVILATGLHTTERTAMALDIGTNTEVSLAHRGRIQSISCASGPAFEGGHLTHGTWAIPGAIDQVSVSSAGVVAFNTIGHTPPHGLCGSGILDAIAGLFRLGIIDRKGGLSATPDNKAPHNQGEFILVPAEQSATCRAITISQKDVSEVQLAKAAIRAGIDILLGETGITWKAVDEVILTGGFGTVLDPKAAIDIGMFPPFQTERIRTMQNGAGIGALRCLVSTAERVKAVELSQQIGHVELMHHPEFKKRFGHAMYFPAR